MKLHSLTDNKRTANFQEALWSGLAPGGGLYYPDHLVPFTANELKDLEGQDYRTIALAVLEKWLDNEIPAEALREIVAKALNFDIPLVDVGPMQILELFHGPTMAFKDVAARFLAQCFEYYAKEQNKAVNIVVATSGDTGGAIANAFGGLEDVKVFVLFPKGRISGLQYSQLTRVAGNIEPLEVDGSFDDCQRLVKQALNDTSLACSLSSANSINIGRLLPQSTYYAHTANTIGGYEVIIPTGNLGNATAALLAHEIGLGPAHITLASNANDVLYRYHQTGVYEPKISIKTLSNAMDVGDPNNFQRFLEPFQGDVAKLRKLVDVYSVDDEATASTIKNVYEKYGYLLDPHTAVAWNAAEQSPSKLPKVVVGTASPYKFAKEITDVTGIVLDDSQYLLELNERPTRLTAISGSYDDFKYFVESNCISQLQLQ